MTLSAGTRFSSYEILRAIGAGGMGEVYRARDTKLSRDVAIKVLPPTLAGDAERLARFEREARHASALSHPNIVTIYEIGRFEESSFIAMELVEGKTLKDVLAAGPIPLKKTLSIATQIAEGLAKSHSAGIVHRDLKPENVMVTREGLVKILDFGLAKLVPVAFERSDGAERPTVTRQTRAGTILGTVGYMSPEQASGEPTDFRSDQFSLGAILYEMITGKRAFERPTDVQTLSAIIEDEPEPLAALSPKTPTNLVWIVERCLAKDPEDRYGSTRDLARDLAAFRDRSSVASATGIEPPAARRLRVSRASIAIAALAVAGMVFLAFAAGRRLQARRDRETPPPKRTTLTFRRGFLTGARFAPDGQTIVFSASWDGKPSEIFTTRVGSTESRSLGIVNAAILAVSSTGEMAISLDCSTRENPCNGTLARVPLAGGAPREVLEEVVSADWSPDGQELAVIRSNGRGRDRLEYPIGTVLCETDGYLRSLRVSPLGDLVAFLEQPRRDSARAILSVVDRAGKKRVLTREWSRLRPILWSLSGKEVFFSLWGGRETRGADLSGRTRGAPWIPGLDDVSREGLFLDTDMLLEPLRRMILAHVPGTPGEKNLSWLLGSMAADLSQDGQYLLLGENRTDPDQPNVEAMTTFLRKTDGSDAKILGEGRALALSPDRKWALVRHPTEVRLVLLPTGAGEPKSLPGGEYLRLRFARFFPDAQRILFTADDKKGVAHSYVQRIDGSEPEPLGEDGLRAVLVSPDGGRIAAMAAKGGPLIYRADGREPRPIRGALPEDTLLQWSSDGGAIYVRGPEKKPLTIYRLDLATGRRERWKELVPPDLAGFSGFAPGAGSVCVTPDGQYYAYTVLTDSSRLILAEAGPQWWK